MKLAPFTIEDALSIASNFQHLVHKEYKDMHTERICKVRAIGIFPYDDRQKMIVAFMYENLLRKHQNTTMQTIFEYIEENGISEFDVVLASCVKDSKESLSFTPIQLIATEGGMEYGFALEPV